MLVILRSLSQPFPPHADILTQVQCDYPLLQSASASCCWLGRVCHRDLNCSFGMQAAVDRMLAPPPPNASAEAQQQHLKLLVEVYKRTHNLAEQLQVQSIISCSHRILCA